jgi:hypothetical protein
MVTDSSPPDTGQKPLENAEQYDSALPPLQSDKKLLRKVLIYHFSLAVLLVGMAVLIPGFIDILPVGGVTELVERTDEHGLPLGDVPDAREAPPPVVDSEIINTVIKTTVRFDRLGQGRQLAIVLLGVWLLVLPVSWVHKGIHRASAHDHSLDDTTLILPGVVASIVMVVQHSLALAFSLAGIVAGVQFRRALQDTFDALFILVAIGTGISAGVAALEIAAVLTVFFCYATLYVYYVGDGLESHHEAHRKAVKRARKLAIEEQQNQPEDV